MRKVYTSVRTVGLVDLSAEFSSPGGIVQSATASGKGHPVIHPVVPGGACEISSCYVPEYGVNTGWGASSLADIARDAITFPHRIAVENIDYVLSGEIYINIGIKRRSGFFFSSILVSSLADAKGQVMVYKCLLACADWLYFKGLAIPDVPISVASLMRRFSVALTFIMGARFFHETNLLRKSMALALILVGITLLCIA